jgi:hypothetical protein
MAKIKGGCPISQDTLTIIKKFGLGQEKSPNTLLYQGWMGVLLYVLFLLPPCGSR